MSYTEAYSADFHFTRKQIEDLIRKELASRNVKINSFSYKLGSTSSYYDERDSGHSCPNTLVEIVVASTPLGKLDTV